MFGADQGRRAAVKIQTAFRGYLVRITASPFDVLLLFDGRSCMARKALQAVKGLVKLQADVQGYLVRRRAPQTLQSMQALIRAQATVQMQKGRLPNEDCRFQPRNSIERFDDTRSEHTTHLFTAGGYRHLLKRPSTLLMRARRQLKSTLAGLILDLGEPTPACAIAAKTAHSSKHSPLYCHSRCPQLISQHLAAEILVTSIGCLPGRNAGSTLPKAPRGFQILVACP